MKKGGLELIRKAAEQGHLAAQYELGVNYTEGNGTEVDEKEALKWFRRAAESGYAEAQYWLGVNYSYGGSGLEQNNGESGEWLKKAANQGHIDALHWLGEYYRETNNDEEAAKCWQLAAEEGHPGSQYMLACCYADGFGVDKDEEKAKKWGVIFKMCSENDT